MVRTNGPPQSYGAVASRYARCDCAVFAAEVTGLVWTLVGKRGGQLGVRRANGPTVNFMGFKPAVRDLNQQLQPTAYTQQFSDTAAVSMPSAVAC